MAARWVHIHEQEVRLAEIAARQVAAIAESDRLRAEVLRVQMALERRGFVERRGVPR